MTQLHTLAAMSSRLRRTGRIAIGLTLLISIRALAYDFVPTAAQWAAWPPYCQARYASTMMGTGAGFANAVSGEDVDRWRMNVGDQTFNALHHYCAGIAYLGQASLEPNPQRHGFLLNNALNEITYTYERAETDSPIYPDIVIALARTDEQLGKREEATRLLQNAIQTNTGRADLYGALAIMQRRSGNPEDARATLLKGDAALNGKSAEISYNLGLICLELKDFDAATTYAKRAYELGYPLPGLKNKLQKLGRWTE